MTQSGMQPIESAPPNRRVLVWCAKDETFYAAQLMHPLEGGEPRWVYARFWDEAVGGNICLLVRQPTHWCELPIEMMREAVTTNFEGLQPDES